MPSPVLLLLAVLQVPAADSSAHGGRVVPMVRAAPAGGPIHIDGRLDEPAWAQAVPVTDFTQRDPHEGQPASERTEVRVLIGTDALYIGARMFDDDPRAIKAVLARRDEDVQSDMFEVLIDSYHDHLSAVRFRITPAGAIRDAILGASAQAAGDSIDPGDGGAPFVIGNPDFNFRSLRANAVLRWEWRPGSTLFIVWQQGRQDVGGQGDFRLRRDLDALVHAPSSNIVAVKVSYWLGL